MQVNVTSEALSWYPEPVVLPELDAWFSADLSCVEEVKANSKRSVYALCPSADAAPSYFLKYDTPSGIRDVAKTLLRPRSLREFKTLETLYHAGVVVPEPIVCGWKGTRGIMVTRAVPEVTESWDAWVAIADDQTARALFLERLADFVATLLSKDVWHPDMHAGNLLVSMADGSPRFVLTDVFGCRVGGELSPQLRVRMLHLLNPFIKELPDEQALTVVTRAAPGSSDPEALLKAIWAWRARDASIRWRGREKKLLGTCSHTDTVTTTEGSWHIRRDMDVRLLDGAVRAHRNLRFNSPEDLLKDDEKRSVSQVAPAGKYFVVKEFHKPFPLKRWSPERRSWLANWRLELAVFPVAKYYGWLRDKDGHGFLVMEYLEGQTVDLALRDADDDQRQALLLMVKALLEKLYRWQIVHGDFKLQNIILQVDDAGKRSLALIDNDEVLFDRTVTAADRAANFRHMRSSVPERWGLWPAMDKVLKPE